MTIVVVGEVLVDLVWPMGTDRIVPHPGGSPANVAIGLHRLDRQVTFLSCWGDDPPGELIDSYLAATGVPVRRIPSASGRSTIAHAYLDPATGSATYDFLAAWDPTEITVPAQTTLLHTGSLAAVVEPGATPILKACRALRNNPSCAVSIDLNVRPAVLPDRDTYRTQIERLTREADLVKASDEDLAWLYPDRDPEDTAQALLTLGPETCRAHPRLPRRKRDDRRTPSQAPSAEDPGRRHHRRRRRFPSGSARRPRPTGRQHPHPQHSRRTHERPTPLHRGWRDHMHTARSTTTDT